MTAPSLLRVRLRRYWAVYQSRSQMQAAKKMGRDSRRSAAGSNLLKLVTVATIMYFCFVGIPTFFKKPDATKGKAKDKARLRLLRPSGDSSSSVQENMKEEAVTEGGIPVIHIKAKETWGTPLKHNYQRSTFAQTIAMLKEAEMVLEKQKSLAGHGTSRECHVPAEVADKFPWKYYDNLIETNRKTGELARSIKEYVPKRDSSYSEKQSRIPHRLIFTNKFNLLDCNLSSSSTSDPSDHTLAHNVHDTINAYKKEWASEDVEVTFLTDKECIEAISDVEPELLKYYDDLIGSFKGDVCRAAYLYKYGGYYLDLDLLVVHPLVANAANEFVTVKAAGYKNDPQFFQAFLAVAPKNKIIMRSIYIMLQILSGNRKKRGSGLLGTQSLQDAWAEVAREDHSIASTGKNRKVYLLSELHRDNDFDQSVPKQENYGEPLFTAPTCNFFVADEEEKSVYFYSHILGASLCGRMNHLPNSFH